LFACESYHESDSAIRRIGGKCESDAPNIQLVNGRREGFVEIAFLRVGWFLFPAFTCIYQRGTSSTRSSRGLHYALDLHHRQRSAAHCTAIIRGHRQPAKHVDLNVRILDCQNLLASVVIGTWRSTSVSMRAAPAACACPAVQIIALSVRPAIRHSAERYRLFLRSETVPKLRLIVWRALLSRRPSDAEHNLAADRMVGGTRRHDVQ
jgi:hypothetical protein